MKMLKLDHVAISVKSLDDTLKFYTDYMGVKKGDISKIDVPGMKMATIKVNGANLEFVQYLNESEILARFANPSSDALHHVAINVDNIEDSLAAVKKQGGTLIHEKPMEIPGGMKVAFALPKNSKVLIEFMQG